MLQPIAMVSVVRLAEGVTSGVVSDPELREDYLEQLAKLVPRPGFRHGPRERELLARVSAS